MNSGPVKLLAPDPGRNKLLKVIHNCYFTDHCYFTVHCLFTAIWLMTAILLITATLPTVVMSMSSMCAAVLHAHTHAYDTTTVHSPLCRSLSLTSLQIIKLIGGMCSYAVLSFLIANTAFFCCYFLLMTATWLMMAIFTDDCWLDWSLLFNWWLRLG